MTHELSSDARRVRQRLSDNCRQNARLLASELDNYSNCFKMHERIKIKEAIDLLWELARETND